MRGEGGGRGRAAEMKPVMVSPQREEHRLFDQKQRVPSPRDAQGVSTLRNGAG